MNNEEPKMRKVDLIYFHKDTDPVHKIEVYTVRLNDEPIPERGISIALYSPEPERDWCLTLSPEEALAMARRIIETYERK